MEEISYVNIGHLRNCCVNTIGNREEQDRGGGGGRGPSVCGEEKMQPVLEFPRNVWRKGSFQRRGGRLNTVELKGRVSKRQVEGPSPSPKGVRGRQCTRS